MRTASRITHKLRQNVPVRPIQADKKPYLVRGMPRTVMYLTSGQAAKRLDLIPQSQQLSLGLDLATTMTIIFNYLFTQTEDRFVCRVPIRIFNGQVLAKGVSLDGLGITGLDLHQWVGKSLNVTIENNIYTITGLAD